ncbi:hypothetical protein EW145_g3820 [Phellinidium pouzarii]|uniref:Uncharacterized protein n=1 Tax=Phellinidium pouzarii TaxID=167371 RepID=A0A4S4L5R9_9AGAM|nr:hypothetical protein EW145_g3820 [Phellinidium pouzarii]
MYTGGDGFEDSFDDDDAVDAGFGDEEATVFGLPPAQRASDAPSSGSGGQLRLLGQDLLDDTTALSSRSRPNAIPETPTPWNGTGGPSAF